MFFRKKKEQDPQLNIRNREKFGSELRDANRIDQSGVRSQESGEEQSAISSQQSGEPSGISNQQSEAQSGEESTVYSLPAGRQGQQSTVEESSSYAEASEDRGDQEGQVEQQSGISNQLSEAQSGEESTVYSLSAGRQGQQSTVEESGDQGYQESQEDKPEIVQSKTGTVKVKRNWDAYSLPDYLKNEDTQIQMEIKQSPKEQYFKIKRRLGKLDTLLEILPYWKSWITMFSLVFSIFTVVMLSFVVIGNFNNLKSEIPLFYNQQKLGSDQVNKSVFLFVPVAAFFFNLVIIRLSMMVYNFDRKLVLSINVALNLINLLLIIGVTQVISLILN